jgi:hypothetical protein
MEQEVLPTRLATEAAFRRWLLFIPLLYLLLAIALAYPVWWFCGDEGFYAYAARCVMEGQWPYRDFMFGQMPIMPYVYGGWFAIFGTSVESGRLCAIVLTTIGVALSMAACRRAGGSWAALIAGLLWLSSPHLIGDLLQIRTQPICQVLICGAIYCLAVLQERSDARAAACAMGLMTLAFLTRLTMIVPMMLVWAYVGWQLRGRTVAFGMMVLANIAAIAACVAFFWADGRMWFGVYVTHRDFWGNAPWTWGRLGWTVKGWIGNQFPIVLCFVFAMTRFVAIAVDRRRWSELQLPALLLASYWGLTLLQWSQVQNYPTHHSVSAAYAIVFSGLMLHPLLEAIPRGNLPWLAVASAATIVVCLPYTTSEFVSFGARAFTFGKPSYIAEALQIVGRHAKPGDELLSFNVELAVNGRYRMYPGCEQSEWSYMPQVTDEFADRYHLLNANRLLAALRDGAAPVLAMTDRDFGLMAAGNQDFAATLKKLIDDRYQNVGIVKQYGMFQQNLYIFKNLRPAVETP